MFTRIFTTLTLLSLVALQGCAWRAPNVPIDKLHTLVVLSASAEQHLHDLGEGERLPIGSYQQFLHHDGSPNSSAIAAVKPDMIYLPQHLKGQQANLETIAPVAMASQFGNHKHNPLRQEYMALATLTHNLPSALRTWQKLKKPLQQVHKQLANYPDVLLVFAGDDGFYVHNGSAAGQVLQQVFAADLVDRHLSPERKPLDAEYLHLVRPQTVFVVAQNPPPALPQVNGSSWQVLLLPAELWAQPVLTTAHMPKLSEQLLKLLQR